MFLKCVKSYAVTCIFVQYPTDINDSQANICLRVYDREYSLDYLHGYGEVGKFAFTKIVPVHFIVLTNTHTHTYIYI